MCTLSFTLLRVGDDDDDDDDFEDRVLHVGRDRKLRLTEEVRGRDTIAVVAFSRGGWSPRRERQKERHSCPNWRLYDRTTEKKKKNEEECDREEEEENEEVEKAGEWAAAAATIIAKG
ncbi:hypothetical protein HYC85_005073 [Camellia sinensis]|uniref:Uncharacterized protein n=1 Tax=Camellia sinensis TaxID=4442 RepID=A0A7J7I169_CAMSI|nr:hypothetical protein HYC85_005073 [Camellia sinensis]